ncbi:MAG: periplasmic heavy metal sensor [Polyangiaceae bacterium]
MRYVKTLATALVLSLAAAPAIAAPTSGAPLGQAAKPAAKKGKGGGKAKRFERAGISKEKMEKVKAVVKKNKAKHKAIREEIKKNRQALKKLLDADSNDQAAYKKALDGLEAAQKKNQALRESEKKEIAKILTPKEIAKLLGAGRGMRGGKGGRRGGGGPRGNGDFDG